MNQNHDENRWALPDLDSAVAWAKNRLEQKMAVAIDPLGEYAQDLVQAEESLKNYLSTIKQLSSMNCQASIAIKLSAIGLNFAQPKAEEFLWKILDQARASNITAEIDIEGTPSVAAVCQIAQLYSTRGYKIVLALQAYLDRTHDDLEDSMLTGLKIRLVKGAYRGDTDDFAQIQQKFMKLFDELLAAGQPFDVGTHDPELLKAMQERLNQETKKLVCFGFLKGLADKTKLDMVAAGYQVAEYIPFGSNRRAYETRRHAYLKRLEEAGRQPAP